MFCYLKHATEFQAAFPKKRFNAWLAVRSLFAVVNGFFLHSFGINVITHDVVSLQRYAKSRRKPKFAQSHESDPHFSSPSCQRTLFLVTNVLMNWYHVNRHLESFLGRVYISKYYV